MRGMRRYIEDLLGSRRPRPFHAEADDDTMLRAAINLRAARPGSDVPNDEFVAGLEERLTNELAPAPTVEASRRPSRRQFVQAASVAATAAALGAGVDHVVSDGSNSPSNADQMLIPNDGQWRTVTASADLAEGGVQPFDLGTVVGFLTRTHGQVRAVSGVCTHLGCRLALEAATRRLDCPCHNAAFALTGQVVEHQLRVAPRPLPHLLAREVDGAVQVFGPAASTS